MRVTGKEAERQKYGDGKERMHVKGAFHPEVAVGCYWEGRRTKRRQLGPKGWPHSEVEQSRDEGSRGMEAVLGELGYGQGQQEVAGS